MNGRISASMYFRSTPNKSETAGAKISKSAFVDGTESHIWSSSWLLTLWVVGSDPFKTLIYPGNRETNLTSLKHEPLSQNTAKSTVSHSVKCLANSFNSSLFSFSRSRLIKSSINSGLSKIELRSLSDGGRGPLPLWEELDVLGRNGEKGGGREGRTWKLRRWDYRHQRSEDTYQIFVKPQYPKRRNDIRKAVPQWDGLSVKSWKQFRTIWILENIFPIMYLFQSELETESGGS